MRSRDPKQLPAKPGLLALGTVLVLLALAPQAASAAQGHAFSTAFGEPGHGAGQLSLQTVQEQNPDSPSPASGLGVDDETGVVYVADSGNHRVDAFAADGAFIRAFGWEVDASAPEAKLQSCTALTGCQAGAAGTEPGQLGTPTFLAVDNSSSPSRGDVYVASGVGVQGQDELQEVKVENATGGTFTLSFEGEATAPIPYDAGPREMALALGRVPAIGFGNALVRGGLPAVTVQFSHRFESTNVPQLVANPAGLEGAGAEVQVATKSDGVPGAPEVVTKFGPEGELIEGWGAGGQLSSTPILATGTGRLTTGSAIGTGDVTKGSTTITNVATESGEFKVGQGIESDHEPTGYEADSSGSRRLNYITAVGAGTLTLAKPASGSGTGVVITSSNRVVTNLTTNPEGGAFEGGQTVSGAGIPPGTQIHYVEPGFMVLRRPATAAGSGVTLSADRRFSPIGGMAVDGSGGLSLFIRDGVRYLDFDQAGGYTGEVTPGGGLSAVIGLAFDSAGAGYLASREDVRKFAGAEPLGDVYRTPIIEPATSKHAKTITGVAVQPASGDLYVDEGAALQDVSRQCEPSLAGCPSSQEFGSGDLAEAGGIALDPGGTLYAADAGPNQIAVFAVSLEANAEAATAVQGRSAVLRGSVDPEGGEVTACRFQHGLSRSYGGNLPCLNGVGEEVGTEAKPITAPTQVHAPLEGLEAGVTYHYRLRVRNAAAEEIHSEDEEVETLILPRIEAAEATEITAATATLGANINPQGPPVTSCQIEWGTSTAYGTTVPCEPESLPAGTEPKPVVAHLSGLSDRTTYHWRVVAEDENGAQSSPDHTFVHLPGPPAGEVSQECGNEALREANGSTALPDCRAYEQITPSLGNGAYFRPQLIPASLQYGLADDGARFLAPTLQCFGGAPSCNAVRGAVATGYEFSRGDAGWGFTPLNPPTSQFAGVSLLLANADSGSELLGLPVTAPGATEGRDWLYARRADGSLQPIGPVGTSLGRLSFKISQASSSNGWTDATADLSHVVYQAEQPLWGSFDQTKGGDSVYEYAGAAEHPFLVAVSGGQGSTDLIGTCGAILGSAEKDGSTNGSPALSEDGRTAYFTVNPCGGGSGANAGVKVPAKTLYARVDGEGPGARTVKISAPAPEPQCGAACQAQPPKNASFAGASVDGSMAYFLSQQQLTDEASQGSENLYLFRDPQEQPLGGDHLVDVSAGDRSGQGPGVQGVMATSANGQRIYFVAEGVLTGANAEGKAPAENAANLYVFDAAEEDTRFVATLPADAISEYIQWLFNPGSITNTTPDGRYLLFTSHAGLTPDAARAEGPEQVYRYDAVSERLQRISVGQKGFADNGNAGEANARIVPASPSQQMASGHPAAHPSISSDGSRVFFESPLALTPGALNEVPVDTHGHLAENVYEWEEGGAGTCEEAGGCVYLISDGRDASEGAAAGSSAIELVGADPSGEDVLFATNDSLVPGDTNTGRDIYDARVGGGFAPPPRRVPCETSEACHPGGSGEGQSTPAGSSSFSGPAEGLGHPYASRCPKGKAKRQGKCVKKHGNRKHRANHKPKGGK